MFLLFINNNNSTAPIELYCQNEKLLYSVALQNHGKGMGRVDAFLEQGQPKTP